MRRREGAKSKKKGFAQRRRGAEKKGLFTRRRGDAE